MSVLRISRRGYPTQLIPLDDGATPYRRGAYIGGARVTAAVIAPRPRTPVSKPPRTLEQIAADAVARLDYQRRYRARMRP